MAQLFNRLRQECDSLGFEERVWPLALKVLVLSFCASVTLKALGMPRLQVFVIIAFVHGCIALVVFSMYTSLRDLESNVGALAAEVERLRNEERK